MCLIGLSSAGMQKLPDMCSTYAAEQLLTYKGCKSYSLWFKPKHIKLDALCFHLNKLKIPKVIMISIKNCDIDLKSQMRKFYANINILSRVH